MDFYEKLDFLMNITNTTNAMLGNVTSFDASYISRIRSGKRDRPKNKSFTSNAAQLFSKKFEQDYQKNILQKLIPEIDVNNADTNEIKKHIEKWLNTDNDYIMYQDDIKKYCSNDSINTSENIQKLNQFYYGNEGKRNAVEIFLTELCNKNKPPTLLLYSNEDFSWLYENPAFSKKWAMLLMSYFKNGGKIKIIHTISRDINEMTEALKKWIPIYFTGQIEPYFYPKLQDRVFRRTLFIAEGFSAITSNSVGDEISESVSLLTHDEGAVKGLENEYNQFFSLCRPLMNIYRKGNEAALSKTIDRFISDKGVLITMSNFPSLYTLSEASVKRLSKEYDMSYFENAYFKSLTAFKERTKNKISTIDILSLIEPEQLKNKAFCVPLIDIYSDNIPVITSSEYIAHIETIIDELKINPYYNVIIYNNLPSNTIICIKEDSNVLILKNEQPSLAFQISDQRMVSAFYESLMNASSHIPDKATIICGLEKYVQTCKSII